MIRISRQVIGLGLLAAPGCHINAPLITSLPAPACVPCGPCGEQAAAGPAQVETPPALLVPGLDMPSGGRARARAVPPRTLYASGH